MADWSAIGSLAAVLLGSGGGGYAAYVARQAQKTKSKIEEKSLSWSSLEKAVTLISSDRDAQARLATDARVEATAAYKMASEAQTQIVDLSRRAAEATQAAAAAERRAQNAQAAAARANTRADQCEAREDALRTRVAALEALVPDQPRPDLTPTEHEELP